VSSLVVPVFNISFISIHHGALLLHIHRMFNDQNIVGLLQQEIA